MELLKLERYRPRFVIFLIVFLICVISTVIYLTIGQVGGDNVLIQLSSQFIKWKVSLPLTGLPPRDISDYYNNYYVYFGPLPSIVLIPFVFIFGISLPQVTLGIFSMAASFISVYFISRKFKFDKTDSLWLSLFFVFSTVLFSSSIVNITAWQVEAFAVPFVLFAIWSYLSRKSLLLTGIFIALAVMTRFTLVLATFFFFLEMVQKRITLRQFVLLLIPVIIALAALGLYNNRRFHSFLETGYNYNISKNDFPISGNYKYGQVSLEHLPANLYSFLIMAPVPVYKKGSYGFNVAFPYLKADGWGVAIWFTSPLFLYLLTNFKMGKYTISAIGAAIFLAIPVFLWYSIGFAQFGYRYALDFLPFLFLILITSLGPRLSRNAIFLIILGVVFNLIYSTSLFGYYPLFGIHLTN